MNSVYFLLVPAAFLYFLTSAHETDIAASIVAYISGLVAGVCALLLVSGLLFFIPADTALFGIKFLQIFLVETAFPFFLGLTALYFMWDSPFRVKISHIRSQFFGIASVVLPYIHTSFYSLPDFWARTMIPVFLLSLLFLADSCIRRLLASRSLSIDPVDLWLALSPVIGSFVLFDVCKTLWYFNFSALIYLPLSLIPVLGTLIARLIKYRA